MDQLPKVLLSCHLFNIKFCKPIWIPHTCCHGNLTSPWLLMYLFLICGGRGAFPWSVAGFMHPNILNSSLLRTHSVSLSRQRAHAMILCCTDIHLNPPPVNEWECPLGALNKTTEALEGLRSCQVDLIQQDPPSLSHGLDKTSLQTQNGHT